MIDPLVVEQMMRDRVVFVRTDVEIADFVKPPKATLHLYGKSHRIDLSLDGGELRSDVSVLLYSLLGEGRTVLAWDLKPLVTHLRHRLKAFEPKATFFDLKLMEAFLGLSNKPPESWAEAVKRVQGCSRPEVLRVHRSVHIPLAMKVIPTLELGGVVDSRRCRTLYSSYEIEGQTTGRLRCSVPSSRYINPHSLDVDGEEAAGLIPTHPHDLFVSFDYKNMEVAVLHHLSGDEVLGAILADREKDVYVEIYKAVTGFKEVDPKNARHVAKSFFLPIVYGQGPSSLMDSLGIDEDTARELHSATVRKFQRVFAWVNEQHERAEKTSMIVDCFGRVRVMEEKMYRARHFVIAAPAALLCMEKLVALHAALPGTARLVFSIHDGYYLTVNRKHYKEVCAAVREVLEKPGDLCPGLSLRTSCSIGKSLSNMQKFF